jgi:phosphonate transport system substrate-binding protein
MNPVHYTVFANDPGYRAFGKQKGKKIKGILVVRKENPIKDLSDLDGKTLAFPAPAAFAASVLLRGLLSKKGVSFTPKYVGSHDSVYLGVVKGLYPAGGGIQRTFYTVKPETSAQLKVLWITDGYTPHAFAAYPRVPKAVVDAVQVAMVDMFNDPAGKKLLEVVGFKQGIEAAKEADWADVRALGFTELPK